MVRNCSSGTGDLEPLLERLRIDASPPSVPAQEPELITAPLVFLANAFKEASRGRRPEELTSDWGAAECLMRSLEPLGGWEAVPLLSSLRNDQVQSGRLVRFRGMVQDMFDPEFYVAVYSQVGGNAVRVHVVILSERERERK